MGRVNREQEVVNIAAPGHVQGFALLRDGLTMFSLTFHSPSVVPGHTPYVRSHADLSTFLKTIERYFEFFFGELGGQPSTPERFRQDLLGRLSTTPV